MNLKSLPRSPPALMRRAVFLGFWSVSNSCSVSILNYCIPTRYNISDFEKMKQCAGFFLTGVQLPPPGILKSPPWVSSALLSQQRQNNPISPLLLPLPLPVSLRSVIRRMDTFRPPEERTRAQNPGNPGEMWGENLDQNSVELPCCSRAVTGECQAL